jgi:tetratricopeptide (TPR) repeat protein
MRCPKCGTEVDIAATECPRCGVVFAKIASNGSPPSAQGKQPISSRSRVLQWAIGCVIVIAALSSQLRKEYAEAGWYKGAAGYDRGMAEHNNMHRPMLVYFYTDWCPHCRDLERRAFSAREFRDRFASLIKVKVNTEGGSSERAVTHRYYSGRYIPAVFLVAEGTGPRLIPNYRDTAEFFAAIDGHDAGDAIESQRSLLDRGNAAEPHFLNGVALVNQGRRVEAAFEFQTSVQIRPNAQSYDYLAWLALEKADWGAAVDYAAKIIDIDPNYDHGRGYTLRAQAYRQMGKNFEASVDADRACNLGDKDACKFSEELRAKRSP